MLLPKKVIYLSIAFTFTLMIITLILLINTLSNYGVYRHINSSFRVLSDPSIQSNGNSYQGVSFMDFTLPDISGHPFSFHNVLAPTKVVILFNTQDCAGCLGEYRLWKKLDSLYSDNVVSIIGISNNRDISDLVGFINEREICFPILVDQDNIIRKSMGFRLSPLRIIIDNNNKILDLAITSSSLSNQTAVLSYIQSLTEKQKE